MKKIWRILGLLALAKIAALVVLICLFVFDKAPSKPFDPERWSEDVQHRFHMADDLVKRKYLLGKDTAQVKALLGQPDRPEYRPGTFVYHMGTGHAGFGVSFHSLVIQVREGRADSVEHVVLYD